MKSGGLFAGYGGLDMAVHQVFGAEPAWFSEIDEAPSKILAHHWPDVPNHGDITQIDWEGVEPVDILTGGFPCQDVSAAGKRAGLKPGTRSGLWNHMAYAISKLRPRYVVAENVRGLLSAEAHSDVEPCPWCLGDGSSEPALRALGAVLGDLAGLGYDARWCGLPASSVGAPHGRFRVFVVATDTRRLRGEPGRGRTAGEASRIGAFSDALGRSGSFIAADTTDDGRERGIPALPAAGDGQPVHPGETRSAADAESQRRREGGTESAWELWRPDASERGSRVTAWGQYEPAIRRWERELGRPAPEPTEPNSKGNLRLSPHFVEWMMGLPAGHVTDVPGVNRNAQLKALGNGVVPQQAVAALRYMLQHAEVAA